MITTIMKEMAHTATFLIVIRLYVIMLNVGVCSWVPQDLTNHQLILIVANFYYYDRNGRVREKMTKDELTMIGL